MTAKEMGNSALAGFWWGAGFTIAFVLVRLVMLVLMGPRVGALAL